MTGHIPRRRCVGCGRIAPKPELVRITAVPGDGRAYRAVLDLGGTLPGRGAYLCRAASTAVSRAGGATGEPAPEPKCVRLAERNRGIARTLRRAVTLDIECLESEDR